MSALKEEPQASAPVRVFSHVERAGNCLVIRLAGEIDNNSAWRVRQQVTSAMDSAGLWRVVLDLGDVTFCDSSGLRALVAVWEAAERQGGSITLARVPPACELPLALTGLAKAFGTWPTIAQAVASMRPQKIPSSQVAGELIEQLAAVCKRAGTVLSDRCPAAVRSRTSPPNWCLSVLFSLPSEDGRHRASWRSAALRGPLELLPGTELTGEVA